MAIQSFSDITENQFDLLKEIGNIGAGNATTALSQLLNKKINMLSPSVKLVDFQQLAELVGGQEKLVVGILVTLNGDINGLMMFMLDAPSAKSLVDSLFQREEEQSSGFTFSALDFSALEEVGHIIDGAYLSALSVMTEMKINTSVPSTAFDMAAAILSVPAIEFGKLGDKALVIESIFEVSDVKINGYFILIPDMESYNKIMSKFGL